VFAADPSDRIVEVVSSRPSLPHVVGRYALYGEIASGGMATVHYGRLLGPVGFARTVAIKRLHPQFAKDPEFVSMFLDEARLAGRIRHPNVVQTVDVVALEGELFLVMEYVQGESLARLVRAARSTKQNIPLPVVSAILCAALHGLHAAHEATNERGEPLNIVHRDVSPQNILIGADGVPRVLDFGVAKAAGRVHTTREGQVKGKLAYMAPETLIGRSLDRRTDVYAAGVVLWETLTLQRLFAADTEGAVVASVLHTKVEPPSTVASEVPKALDALVMRAIDRDPATRFASAREMALALEDCIPVASATRLTEWVEGLASEVLAQRAKALARIENDSGTGYVPALPAGAEPAEPVTAPSQPPVHEPDGEGSPAEGSLMAASLAEGSQISSVSVSTSALHHIVRRGRRRWWAYAAGPLGALALAALVLAGMRSQTRPAPGAASGLPLGVQPTEPQVPPPPPPTVAAIASPSSTTPATPSLSTPVPAAPSATTRPPSLRPGQATPRGNASPKPCAIKSYIDGDGITHFVKDCK
jgi:serine/threonine protein kinase